MNGKLDLNEKTGFERIQKIEQLYILNEKLDLNDLRELNEKLDLNEFKKLNSLLYERKLDLNNLLIERNLYLNRFKKLYNFISEWKTGSERFKRIEQKNWFWTN